MADTPARDPLVRPATPAEAADPRAMHAANRAAWDEAAERYEGWFDEAVALIRAGGSNLFPVEHDLIGDLRTAAGAAGAPSGRSTSSAPAGATRSRSGTRGATEVIGHRHQPTHARARSRA